MAMQVLINLFIAFLWVMLQESWTVLTFLSGYLIGILILFLLDRFLPTKFYVRTLLAVINLILIFMLELAISAIIVLKEILKPKVTITPGIFTLETDLESDLEIILLSLLITLTPGSVVMEITPDKKLLYVHGLDMPSSIDAVTKSQIRFEKAIKKVTRP